MRASGFIRTIKRKQRLHFDGPSSNQGKRESPLEEIQECDISLPAEIPPESEPPAPEGESQPDKLLADEDTDFVLSSVEMSLSEIERRIRRLALLAGLERDSWHFLETELRVFQAP